MRLNTSLIFILLIVALIYSDRTHSQWYDSQGTALIEEGNIKLARTRAIENALQTSFLVAGASVSSVQQVVNGLLTQDEVSIRASGVVNSVEIIDEIITDESIVVNIRADIFSHDSQCPAASSKKSILLTKPNLLHREQANIGRIFDIDDATGDLFYHSLKDSSTYTYVKRATQQKTDFSRLNNSYQIEKVKDLSMSLASHTDTQFIMFIEINDISFAHEPNNKWSFWELNEFDRNFNFSVYIYDGLNGEQIFEQQYKGTAPWEFKKRESVDVNGLAFRQSKYGTEINKAISKLINDIDEQLMCDQSKGTIVALNNNIATINIGKAHGLKIGDELTLLHSNNITADNGKTYAGFNISPFKIKIVQVSEQSAQGMSENGEVLGSIRINDIVVRK